MSAGESDKNITFMFVTSFGQFGLNTSGVVPAAGLALEDINANPDMLPGYNLVYDRVRDSQVGCIKIRMTLYCYSTLHINVML